MLRKPCLEISFDDRRWRTIPGLAPRLQKTARMALSLLPKALRFPATATLLLTDDKTMRRLNRDFRGQDKPTNVLSFPQFELAGLPKKGNRKAPIPIGDVAFGYQYIVAEAKKTDNILINHACHLLIHGLLHLLGYDHISDKQAVRMERLEQQVMSALGLPDPYAAAPRKETRKAARPKPMIKAKPKR